MPFVEIDFSSFTAPDRIERLVIDLIDRLYRPLRLLMLYFGLQLHHHRRPHHAPTDTNSHHHHRPAAALSTSRRRLAFAHLVAIIIATIVLSIALLLLPPIRSLISTPPAHSLVTFSLSCVYIQSIASLVLLIIWQHSRRWFRLRDHVLLASTGVGILRHRRLIQLIYYRICTVALSTICVLFIIYHVLIIIINTHHHDHLLFDDLIIGICASICMVFWSIVHAIILLSTLMLIAEFASITDDFDDDTNTYQLPVAKHYIFVHYKLRRSIELLNGGGVSCWTTIVSFTSTIALIRILANIGTADVTLIELSVAIALMIVFATQLIAFGLVGIMLHDQVNRISRSFANLIGGDRHLHDQTYTLAIAYVQHLDRMPHLNGLSIAFGLVNINAHTVTVAVLLSIVVIGALRFVIQ